MIIIDDSRVALGRLPQRKLEKAFNRNRSRFGESRKSIVSPLSRWHEIDRSTAPVTAVGSEEARDLTNTLASVRRSNCTCSFPACSFHEDSLPGGRARR